MSHRPSAQHPPVTRRVAARALAGGLIAGSGFARARAATGGTLRMPVPAGAAAKTFNAIAAAFTAQTGIAVDVVPMPLDDVRQKLILDLSTGAGQTDIVVLNNTWLGEMTRFLVDLTPALGAGKDGFDLPALVPSMTALFADGGKQLALPIRIGGRVLVYRKDLFGQAGIAAPPKSWDEFIKAAQALTAPARDQYGFVAPMGQGLNMVDSWGVFLTSYGGSFLAPDGATPAFADAPGQAATAMFVGLYRTDHIMPQDALEYDDSGTIAAMQSGRAAMMLAFSPWVDPLNDPKLSKVAGRIDVAPAIPLGASNGVSMSNGWGFGLSKASKASEAGLRFIRFAASPAVQLAIARDLGNSPTVAAVFRDPAYLAGHPYAPNVLSALDGARPQPNRPGWASVADELGRNLSMALTGQVTPEQALDAARTRAVRILRR